MIHDITGQKFGKLTVVEQAGRSRGRAVLWLCQCECGNTTTTFGGNLRRGQTKSCGCSQGRTTHGDTRDGKRTKEHGVWVSIRQHCYNPKHTVYRYYGGRGITVHEPWRESFANFLQDVGRAPSPQHLLGRIDTSGNYEPSNVQWLTPKEMVRYKRPRQLKKAA